MLNNFNPAQLIGSSISGEDALPFFIEIKLPLNRDGSSTFNRVRETLTRIGVVSSKQKDTLSQTAHILMHRDRFYLAHFKMMYIFDGRDNGLSAQDLARLNTIAQVLEQWGMVEIVNKSQIDYTQKNLNDLKVVKYADVNNWILKEKYGVRKFGLGETEEADQNQPNGNHW